MRGSLWTRCAWLALGVAVVLASPDCPAQTDPDELARRHFESGAAYFEQAEYQEALREFRKAYELSNRPQILRNISIVEERMGNLAGAVAALDDYLAASPDDPDIETIRIRRDNLKKRLEEEEATKPVPVPQPVEEKEEPKPVAPPPKPPPERSPEPEELDFEEEPRLEEGPNRVPAYVLISVGGLAGAGAVITGIFAKNEHDQLKSSCDGSCTDGQIETGKTLAWTSTILTGAAVLGVGVGAILWATAGSSEPEMAGAPRLHVAVGPRAGFAEAQWDF